MPASTCCHCGREITRSTSTLDHVPSKCFLEKPFPANLTTLRICIGCNNSFASDEEYMSAFLGMLLWDGDNPPSRISRILDSNWVIQDDFDHRLAVTDEGYITIEPDEDRLRNVIAKNAVGHLHSFTGTSPISHPDKVSMCPLANLPSEARVALFKPNADWTIAQQDKYRFKVIEHGAVVVRSVIHEYLGTEAIWTAFPQ